MKFKLSAVLAIATCGALFGVWAGHDEVATPQTQEPIPSPIAGPKSVPVSVPGEGAAESGAGTLVSDLNKRLSAMAARRNEAVYPPEAVAAAIAEANAWQTVSDRPDTLPRPATSFPEDSAFLSMNPLKFESLMTGDSISFDIPHLKESREFVVESIEVESDVVVYKGTGAMPGALRFTAVSGDNYTTGSVVTEDGYYQFEFFGADGWMHAMGAFKVEGDDQEFIPANG